MTGVQLRLRADRPPQSFPRFLSAVAVTAPLGPDFSRPASRPRSRRGRARPLSLHGRSPDPLRSSVPPVRGVAHADLQGPSRRRFVERLFISFIKSSSCPPKEPRTAALDSGVFCRDDLQFNLAAAAPWREPACCRLMSHQPLKCRAASASACTFISRLW